VETLDDLSLYCPDIIRTFNPDHKLLNMPKQSKREMSDKLRSGSHNEGVIIGQPTVEAHSTVGATRVTSEGSYT